MKSKLIASFAATLTAILLFSSCKKIDTTDLGNELIPGDDDVITKDTIIDVITDNILSNDTTRMLFTELHGVGIIENDAEFGKTSSFSYASFTPSSSLYPFIKKDSVVIDSVVLSLAFSQLYGDSNSIQEFEVREINKLFDFKDTMYYISHPDFPVQPDLLGTATVDFKALNDTLSYRNQRDTIRTSNELRIKLDTAWARQFVNFDTSDYRNDTLFQFKFRGLEVRANESSPGKRALAYFNLNENARSRITFYCRVQNNGRTDTISPNFIYKRGDPEATLVRRTAANGYLANLNNGIENDELLYLQSSPGSYATIKIPALADLDNRVIHRAELIMEKSPSNEEGYYLQPPTMFIEAQSATGDSAFTIRNDFLPSNSSPGYDLNVLGGVFRNNKYVFNISRYIQSVISRGFPNYTLRVYSPFTTQPFFTPENSNPSTQRVPIVINPLLGGGRVVVYGGGYPDAAKKMRLRIIYSKI